MNKMYKKINKKKIQESLINKGVLGDPDGATIVALLEKLFALDEIAYLYSKSIKNDGIMMKSQRGQKANPAVNAFDRTVKEISNILVELENFSR
ncbi:hypothetical protein [Carboxylicivirga marina]|uniref:hypothetical protein n=1 Tax=Carboxylicivirga marina TaxID=2800988 RepID=UPI0025920E0A|nr:hypothetical protein [uncultured Carboxylicivirga sp.]